MNEAAQTTLAVLSWVVAPTGLVVTSVMLWQNVMKVREAQVNIKQAHLKNKQLEEQLRATEERIYRPSPQEIKDILGEQRAFLRAERDDLMRAQERRASIQPTGAVVIALFLTSIAALPVLGVL